jgi:aarF domain-containing kinase
MNLYRNLSNVLKGALRVTQTSSVLMTTGLGWALGNRPPPAKLLRETFEKLGTTYIKLGQFIASSPSIFPAEYVEEFQHCLDRTPALPFSIIKDVIEAELKQPLTAVFASIDEAPLASASIAQVHAAKLITGEDVVVKVQKPGVKNILLTDLNFLYFSAVMLERFFPKTKFASLSAIVDEIQKCMLEETDFYQEAKNIQEFNSFLEATQNQAAVAPKVYTQASGLRVLTMERFYGVSLTNLESIKKYAKDPANTLVTAMNTWFSSLMHCQSFHADLHAGNLMVLTDGRIGFIDFGIVGRIDPGTWTATNDFIESLTDGNFKKMAKSMSLMGMTKTQVDTGRLEADLRKMYDSIVKVEPDHVMTSAINDNEINRLLRDMVAVGEKHGIRFPRAFALLLKQILYFDRYVKILAPDMNVFMDNRLDFSAQLTSEELPYLMH